MKKSKAYKPKTSSTNKVFTPNGKVDQGNPDRKLLYDREWYVYRKIFLSVNKFCYVCNEKAEVVDHIVAHKNDIVLFKSVTNHLPMCSRCHSTITASFDKFVPPKTTAKIDWINEQRKIRGISTSVRVLPKYGR